MKKSNRGPAQYLLSGCIKMRCPIFLFSGAADPKLDQALGHGYLSTHGLLTRCCWGT